MMMKVNGKENFILINEANMPKMPAGYMYICNARATLAGPKARTSAYIRMMTVRRFVGRILRSSGNNVLIAFSVALASAKRIRNTYWLQSAVAAIE